MASKTLSVDLRCINPLICYSSDLSRFPKDSILRVAMLLDLLSDFIGHHNGECDLLESENNRFALSAQLSGAAQVLEVVVESFQIRKTARRENEVVLEFSAEELEKLTLVAGRQEQSIHDVIVGIVTDKLQAFNPDKRPQ